MTDSAKPICLLLVHETHLMGNMLAAALHNEPDITIVGSVTDVAQALRILGTQAVDLALVSTRLPEGGALKLTRAITRLALQTKVLALDMTEDKQRVLRYVEAGAAGYVLSDASLEDLLQTVRAACDDKAFVSPEIAAAMAQRLSDLAQTSSEEDRPEGTAGLTPRELEVLKLIGKGLTNQQIAEQLVIEVGTVKNHVHKILEKLNVASRAQAAALLELSGK